MSERPAVNRFTARRHKDPSKFIFSRGVHLTCSELAGNKAKALKLNKQKERNFSRECQ